MDKTSNSRQTVVQLLVKMDANGSFSNILLDNTLSKSGLDPRDKAFATALFYGVLERRMTLDYIIRYYSNVEFDSIDGVCVQLLRMGLYQLLYMNSVPDSAAVNETVTMSPIRSKGFINAILRSFLRDGKKIDYSRLDETGALSIEYSCPKWIIKRWISQYGEKTALELLSNSFDRPPLYIKVNTLKCTADELISQLKKEGISAEKNKLLDDCLELGKVQGIETSNAFRKGLFHVQDISSQICARIVKPSFNEKVLDMCAAPGGKSFSMAEIMANRGKILSFDLYSGKTSLIREGAKRLGIEIITADTNDAAKPNADIPKADKVLCDVVCSGLGVIRRKPEIKYRPMKDIELLPRTQALILEVSSSYVKTGGTLIYSTCTLNRDENDGVIDDFLERHSEFTPIIVPVEIPGVENSYKRTFMPMVTGGDGFFTATLRKVR